MPTRTKRTAPARRAGARPTWTPPDLRGRVALVTGASRGAGKGIAAALGESGATVYVTARSVRGRARTDGMPGTIEDTAELVTRRGGGGIAVRCDHSDPAQVKALVDRIAREQGGLDLLVNNAWGGYEGEGVQPQWFWQVDVERHWRGMFENGLWTHLLTARHALPLMLPRRRGLVVGTLAWDHGQYLGSTYDVAKNAVSRFAWGLARELRPHRIAAVAVAPGFMRTERVLAAFKVSEADWRTVPDLRRTETPEYVGRAVASLAGDPKVLRHAGKTFLSGELARTYAFRDADGRRVVPFNLAKGAEGYIRDFERGEFSPG